jgi:hypothetical protein
MHASTVETARAAVRSLAAMAPVLFFSASALSAQTRFEWPDTVVRVASYTSVDECLAATERVRAGIKRRRELTVWPDTFPHDPAEALKPEPALVRETAARCATRFVEPTSNLNDFPLLLALYLAAARDSDAAALVARRLAAVPAKSSFARAAVADSAVEVYLNVRPARVAAAEDILLRRARASTDRIQRLKTYYTLMNAAEGLGDTTRAQRAAKWVVSIADSLTQAERESEAFEQLNNGGGGRMVVYEAVNVLTGLPTILASLRESTAAFVALERGAWAKLSGERPEAIPDPVGQHAPALTADFWFPSEAAHAPRPTPGHVALVVFLNPNECDPTDATGDAPQGCASELADLRRLSERFPALEITILVATSGNFMYVQPPPPAEEADLIRQWLESYRVKGAVLGVTSTPFWRLPTPDERRMNHDVPNVTNYSFGKTWRPANGSRVLIDEDGLVINAWYPAAMAQYIDVLLHRHGGKN